MRQAQALTIFVLLFLMGTPAFADSMCAQKKPFVSDVLIEMETPEPHFDFSKSVAYLNSDGGRSSREWLEKNNMQGVWSSKHMQTQGIAMGGWMVYYEYDIDPEPLDQYWAYACLYVKELKIRMMFRTIIYIPKEYPEGSCAFKLIMPHEMKHYQVNKVVAQNTAGRLRKDMPQILAELEKEHVGSQHLKSHAELMKQRISEIVDVYFKQVMGEEMEKMNGLVDSPEEYASFGRKLRDECGHKSPQVEHKKERRVRQERAPYVPTVNLYEKQRQERVK